MCAPRASMELLESERIFMLRIDCRFMVLQRSSIYMNRIAGTIVQCGQ